MNDKKKPLTVCDSLYIKTINEDHIHGSTTNNDTKTNSIYAKQNLIKSRFISKETLYLEALVL